MWRRAGVFWLAGYASDPPPEFVRVIAAHTLRMDIDDPRLDSERYLALAMAVRNTVAEAQSHLAGKNQELVGFNWL